ncbi:MAG: lipoprotein [Burkholderiales bacterium]|jgi:predicted small lipoprotein YifL|nr:lipoprotein [Burkholderiales bacterium]
MRRALALLVLALLLSACGNKGPLYLPGPDGQDPRQDSRTR